MIDTTTDRCAVCRRRIFTPDRTICEPCELEATRQLTDLPKLLRRLALCLMPGSGGAKGGRVRSSKTAPLPVRLDPLSLIGAGTVSAYDHFERNVTTRREVITLKSDDGKLYDVVIWHRELAYGPEGRPVYVAASDQDGVLPIPTWLDMWEAIVRRHFRDTDPPLPQPYRARVDRRAYTRAALYADRLAVGVDPIEVEVATRFGLTIGVTRADDAADYLADRLYDVCWQMPEAVEMLTELRSLYAAARATAGESDDLVYLGRCPETLVDRGTGDEQPCGARLWQDPFATVIRCRRCRTETGMAKWMWLARRIRDTWGTTIEGVAA